MSLLEHLLCDYITVLGTGTPFISATLLDRPYL